MTEDQLVELLTNYINPDDPDGPDRALLLTEILLSIYPLQQVQQQQEK